MSLEENKKVVRRWYDEVWNGGRPDLIDELATEDFVLHHTSVAGRPVSRENYKQLFSVYTATFPDLHVAVEDMLADGDRVAARLRQTATQQVEFRGVQPSGKSVESMAIVILRLAGGQIAEAWAGERDWVAVLADVANT